MEQLIHVYQARFGLDSAAVFALSGEGKFQLTSEHEAIRSQPTSMLALRSDPLPAKSAGVSKVTCT